MGLISSVASRRLAWDPNSNTTLFTFCSHSMWWNVNGGGQVCAVQEAFVLDRSDEHIGENSWSVCNPQKGIRMAWTSSMSFIYFLQYKSDIGWLDTWPWKQAEIVYPWCPLIHFSIPRSDFWERSSNLFISPSICTQTLSRCQTILPKVSKNSDHPWYDTSCFFLDFSWLLQNSQVWHWTSYRKSSGSLEPFPS